MRYILKWNEIYITEHNKMANRYSDVGYYYAYYKNKIMFNDENK